MQLASIGPRFRAVRKLVFAALLLPFVALTAHADLGPPSDLDNQVTRGVSRLLSKFHVSGHEFDDEISKRCFKLFFKTLDPQKMYFTKADMDEFAPKRTKLDDELLEGETKFAHDVFKRFLKRIDKAIKYADHFIKHEHDFTKDEKITLDADAIDYVTSDEELKERWRKRIKYNLMLELASGTKIEEARKTLKRRYHGFAKRMRLTDSSELLEMYLMALAKAFDPHSNYMSADTLDNFMIAMRLQLEGIGAVLRWEDGKTIVVSIVPGGAADKDGRLRPSDEIVAVGQGEDGEIVDVVGLKLTDVVKKIRGERGTVVRLEVIPTGQNKKVVYKLTRAKIELTESQARGEIIKGGKKPNGEPYKIGVIDLPGFYRDTSAFEAGKEDYRSATRDVRKLLDGFREKKVDAVIVDLRNNTGGFLQEGIDVTGLFIDKGPVVQVKGIQGKVRTLEDGDEGVAWDGPMVVVTSSLSASASEIFAGAIKDYGRGIVVGNRATLGKGSVAQIVELGRLLIPTKKMNIGALTLCIQQFYRVNGHSTQIKGIVADIELPSVMDVLVTREEELDFAMTFNTVKPAEFQQLDYTSPALIAELRKRSQARVAKSEKFQKTLEKIDKLRRLKKRKTVTLNLKKYEEQWADVAKLSDETKEEKPKKEVIRRDHYFNEVLAIAKDYVQLRKSNRN